MRSIDGKRVVQVLQRPLEIAALAINGGEGIAAGRLPLLIPDGFVESGICGLCAFLVFQREPEIIKWLAITRIRIATRQARDRTPEVLFGILKFAAAQAQQSHS